MILSNTYTWIPTRRIAVLTDDILTRLLQKYPVAEPRSLGSYRLISNHFNQYLRGKGDLLTEWYMKSEYNNSIRGTEDINKMEAAARFYFEYARTDKFKRLVNQNFPGKNPKNILDFTLNDLEDLMEIYHEPEVDPRVHALQDKLPEGSEMLYSEGNYQIVEITDAKAACDLGQGTSWCTKDEETATDYLEHSPLYVIYVNGKKRAQLHIGSSVNSIQLMNLRNRPITPDEGIRHALLESGLMTLIFNRISKSGTDSITMNVFKSFCGDTPNPEVESRITLDSRLAYMYAVAVVKGRFPNGEWAISGNPAISVLYVQNALKERFFQAEKLIRDKGYEADYYAALRKVSPSQAEEVLKDFRGVNDEFYK